MAAAVERMAEVFVELADSLVDEFDVIDFLQRLTARATELTGAGAAGLLMADSGDHLHFMAASDERINAMELFQTQQDEGPCRDCYRQGRPIMVDDLRAAGDRWPRFGPVAISAGFASVNAFPMRLRQQVIGSMGLFGVRALRMSERDARIAQALADVATIGILQQRAVREGEVLAGQLQRALDSRVVVEQAKGMIAQKYGVDPGEAFRLLRTYCRTSQQRLDTIATAIVNGDAVISMVVGWRPGSDDDTSADLDSGRDLA